MPNVPSKNDYTFTIYPVSIFFSYAYLDSPLFTCLFPGRVFKSPTIPNWTEK